MKFRRHTREEVGINLTPLIDVVFLLLIFFMVSTTFTRETQLSINLPEAQGQPTQAIEKPIEILIDESGIYRVNGQLLVDSQKKTLQAAIYRLSVGDATLPVSIVADAKAAHEDVVKAMDAAGQTGHVHLTITTRQPSASSASSDSRDAR